MKHAPSRRTFARLVATLLVAGTVTAVAPLSSANAEITLDETGVIDAPRFREIGRLPVAPAIDTTTNRNGTGFMILNPVSRRGYTIVSTATKMRIESFDIDTLQPRRSIVVPGHPLPAGYGENSAANNQFSGEIVHAVDAVAKRIYLPIAGATGGTGANQGTLWGHDNQQMVNHFLVLDETVFDQDPTRAFGAFTFPASSPYLKAYPLMGMAVSRHHVPEGSPGKLLAVFASRNTIHQVPLTPTYVAPPGVYEHRLAQWDAGDVVIGNPPPPVTTTGPDNLPAELDAILLKTLPVTDDWAGEKILQPCGTATLTSPGGTALGTTEGFNPQNSQNYQWGILPTRDAVLLGCQSAPNSGAVVRVELDARTGKPNPGLLAQQLVPLGKPIGDVLVDEGADRLFVRSFGGGGTYWTFDAAEMRFTGSIAGTIDDDTFLGAGVDHGTGRLYTLTPDSCASVSNGLQGGRSVSVRGGLKVTEARLEPVPAPANVVPELAYTSVKRIQVDPVTRRVFVRRGPNSASFDHRYPDCDALKRVHRYPEPFYRVYEDGIPVATQPGDLDDSGLTTNVAEKAGVTEASYLGSGSGYGSRSLLTGGIDALTNGGTTQARSLCGRDDREALVGSVGKVEVSDQTTAAEAASLDADARTQEALGNPLSRCRPQAPAEQFGEENAEKLNACHGLPDQNAIDVREGSFDQAKPGVDENKDGCTDRDGGNRYAARCLGGENTAAPGFDEDDADHSSAAPRDGFEASTECDEKDERAAASSTAAVSSTDVDKAADDSVRVAKSSSAVEVSRKLGKGVTVKVDSIARGVEIPGVGTIGVVRAEATSTATGRDSGARTTFRRTICDVDIQGFVVSSCIGDEKQQQSMVDSINRALGGRGTARLRNPDPSLAGGTRHGYLAGIQRDRKELFADQTITRDRSLAVPALEITLYRGDGGPWGAGRQVFQLAGAQATTSYGIACSYGRRADGKCAAAGEESLADFGDLPAGDSGSLTTITEQLPGESALALTGSGKEGIVTRILRGIPRAIAEALRLLFNNPRELGLLAALWALLYAPCYLGDRRRAVRQVAARRLSSA